MHRHVLPVWVVLLSIWLADAQGAAPLVLSSGRGRMALDRENGSVLWLSETSRPPIGLQSGETGLWEAKSADESAIAAAQFSAGNPKRQFRVEPGATASMARLTWSSEEIDVTIAVEGRDEGFDLTADATPFYDEHTAGALAHEGMEIAALTPEQLAHWLAAVMDQA
jgi:hypothetical protein